MSRQHGLKVSCYRCAVGAALDDKQQHCGVICCNTLARKWAMLMSLHLP
jgi:hypothetical protein